MQESTLDDLTQCRSWEDYCHVIAEKFLTLCLSVNDCEEEILMTPFPILLTAPHDHRARAAEHSRHEINCLRFERFEICDNE